MTVVEIKFIPTDTAQVAPTVVYEMIEDETLIVLVEHGSVRDALVHRMVMGDCDQRLDIDDIKI